MRFPTTVRPAARTAALATFYSKGAEMVGLQDGLRDVDEEWTTQPIQDLCARLGDNQDPLSQWKQRPKELARASGDHLRQKWWTQ